MGRSLESRPRVLVGTLFCGESQIQKCKDAVRAQKYVNVDQLIVSDLPSVEAHNTLWRYWNTHREEYDMIVKVDADMILTSDTTLHQLYCFIHTDDKVNAVQLPLHDYFTDDTIFGLNAFSFNVSFDVAKDDYMCDRTYRNHHEFVVGTDKRVKPLGIGATHAPNPTPQQAFHFGMYRQLKKQKYILDKVRAAWQKHGDDARKWVLIGAKCATEEMRHHTSYLDDKFQEAFKAAEKKGVEHWEV